MPSVLNTLDHRGFRTIQTVIRTGNFHKIAQQRKTALRGHFGQHVGRLFRGCLIAEILEIFGNFGKFFRWNTKIVRRNFLESRNFRRVLVAVGHHHMQQQKQFGGECRILSHALHRIFLAEKSGNPLKMLSLMEPLEFLDTLS